MSNTVNNALGAPNVLVQPIQAWMDHMSSQFGLININLQATDQPDVEKKITEQVASYGKQLGRICDVLLVLLSRLKPDGTFDSRKLDPTEVAMIGRLLSMIGEIDAAKRPAGQSDQIAAALIELARTFKGDASKT